MKLNYIFGLIILLSLLSCKDIKTENRSAEVEKIISPDLQADHFNIWVNNPEIAKKRLNDIGFTSIPDSLSEVHLGQGTTGRYFHFLNTYLELIFVYDQDELEKNNSINKDLDFTKRANFENNGASPLSIALRVKNYDVDKIPFERIKYHQEWMGKDQCIYSAKNSKIKLKEPSIFVVYPEIEAENFESLADLMTIPDEYAFAREFYKHPNGAKKVTKTVITSADTDLNTETIQAVNKIENLTVKNGSEYLMELYFHENIQGKSFDLRPELPLIVYL